MVIGQAFEMGQLMQDLFTCIAFLNSLSDFPHVRSIIMHDLSESTASALYTSTCIITILKKQTEDGNLGSKVE
jgi:hypothetical protein